jgi:uncharacterized protein YbaP (TraB family)
VDSTPPVYLFGTVHLPYDTLWDAIPDNVKTAFSSSGDIFLELQLSDKETSNSLQECQLLSNNRTIDRVLSPELVTRIEQYLEKIRTLFQAWIDEDPVSSLFRGGGSYSDHLFSAVTHDWKRKKPIWVLSLIGSLTEENIRQRKKPVLDRFLDNAARALGKNLKPLEGVNDHCQPLNRLEDDQVETALRIQLDYLESLPYGPPGTLNRDLDAYKCGDLGALIDSQPMLPLPPLTNITNITSDEVAVIEEVETMLYNRLATRRNRRMTKTIDALLKDQRADPVFIAIGAGTHIATHSAQNTDCVPTNNSHTFVYTVEPQIPLGQKEVSLLVRYQVVIWVFGTVKYVFS